jgi:hypothetical protein
LVDSCRSTDPFHPSFKDLSIMMKGKHLQTHYTAFLLHVPIENRKQSANLHVIWPTNHILQDSSTLPSLATALTVYILQQ